MTAYLIRRLLLMIPTLFGISLINFALINLAPAQRASTVSEEGNLDASASVEAGEAERIFRQTFNLDKPVFLNARYDLEDGEIFWRLDGADARVRDAGAKKSPIATSSRTTGARSCRTCFRIAAPSEAGQRGGVRAELRRALERRACRYLARRRSSRWVTSRGRRPTVPAPLHRILLRDDLLQQDARPAVCERAAPSACPVRRRSERRGIALYNHQSSVRSNATCA